MSANIQEAPKLQFNRRPRLESHEARITSDAGLLACRELNGALGLTEVVIGYLYPKPAPPLALHLDLASSESPVSGEQEGAAHNGHLPFGACVGAMPFLNLKG